MVFMPVCAVQLLVEFFSGLAAQKLWLFLNAKPTINNFVILVFYGMNDCIVLSLEVLPADKKEKLEINNHGLFFLMVIIMAMSRGLFI